MRKLTLVAILASTVCVESAHAERQSYAAETCAYLHKIEPSSVNTRIGVTCRWPEKTTYFLCNAHDGSRSTPVDAEAISPRCANPFSR